ncbi:MAG: hypothetical protein JSW21_12990 [Gammaproteobacteria bacterium]|nr:MAG: hypothetical protein JSW21_12990 [Gammaproteobacteria bacterium]
MVLLLATLLSPAAVADESGLQADVSLAALVEKPGTYEAIAIIHDARDGSFLAAPFMRFRESETRTVSVTTESGDILALTVGPVIRGHRAHWLIVWRRGGDVLARAKGTVRSETAN